MATSLDRSSAASRVCMRGIGVVRCKCRRAQILSVKNYEHSNASVAADQNRNAQTQRENVQGIARPTVLSLLRQTNFASDRHDRSRHPAVSWRSRLSGECRRVLQALQHGQGQYDDPRVPSRAELFGSVIFPAHGFEPVNESLSLVGPALSRKRLLPPAQRDGALTSETVTSPSLTSRAPRAEKCAVLPRQHDAAKGHDHAQER